MGWHDLISDYYTLRELDIDFSSRVQAMPDRYLTASEIERQGIATRTVLLRLYQERRIRRCRSGSRYRYSIKDLLITMRHNGRYSNGRIRNSHQG